MLLLIQSTDRAKIPRALSGGYCIQCMQRDPDISQYTSFFNEVRNSHKTVVGSDIHCYTIRYGILSHIKLSYSRFSLNAKIAKKLRSLTKKGIEACNMNTDRNPLLLYAFNILVSS